MLLTLIGTALVLLFMYGNILHAISMGLICALTVGLILFLEALFFNRFSPSAWLITLGQFIFLPVTGLFLTGLAFWPVSLAPQSSYTEIESTPEIAINFVQSSQQNIFGSKIAVQTTSGKTYVYECVTYEGCSWTQSTLPTSQPDSNNSFVLGDCPSEVEPIAFIPPLAPFGIIDNLSIRSCGPDSEIQSRYVLLKDGKIFRWGRYWSVYEPIVGIPAFGLIGVITGISTAITTFISRRRKISKTPA